MQFELLHTFMLNNAVGMM